MFPNLKLQLWKVNIRQNRLARMLGMDEPALSRIVNGYREPSQELRASIAALLGSDPDWLFEPAPEASQTSLANDKESSRARSTTRS